MKREFLDNDACDRVWRYLEPDQKRLALSTLPARVIHTDFVSPLLFRDIIPLIANYINVPTWGKLHLVCKLFNRILDCSPPAIKRIQQMYATSSPITQSLFNDMHEMYDFAWKRQELKNPHLNIKWSKQTSLWQSFGPGWIDIRYPEGLIKRHSDNTQLPRGHVFEDDISVYYCQSYGRTPYSLKYATGSPDKLTKEQLKWCRQLRTWFKDNKQLIHNF